VGGEREAAASQREKRRGRSEIRFSGCGKASPISLKKKKGGEGREVGGRGEGRVEEMCKLGEQMERGGGEV